MGPIGAVQIGMIDDEFIVNPTEEELNSSSLRLVVAGTRDAVMMVEAQADILPEEKILEAILLAHEEIKKVVRFVDEIVEVVGVEKVPFEAPQRDEKLVSYVENAAEESFYQIFRQAFEKEDRQEQTDALYEALLDKYVEMTPEEEQDENALSAEFQALQKKVMRSMILNEGRPDGRTAETIRPLFTETGMIRRTHGSGYFQRG